MYVEWLCVRIVDTRVVSSIETLENVSTASRSTGVDLRCIREGHVKILLSLSTLFLFSSNVL